MAYSLILDEDLEVLEHGLKWGGRVVSGGNPHSFAHNASSSDWRLATPVGDDTSRWPVIVKHLALS